MKLYIFFGFLLVGLLMASSAAACDKQAMTDETTAAVNAGAPSAFDKMPPVGTRAKCLVMGQEFTVTKNTASSMYKGKTYVFCCPGCKPEFDADPKKYVKK